MDEISITTVTKKSTNSAFFKGKHSVNQRKKGKTVIMVSAISKSDYFIPYIWQKEKKIRAAR